MIIWDDHQDDDDVTDDDDQQENYPYYHEAEYNDDDHTDPGCDSEHGRRHIVDISILARFPDQP